MARHSETSPPIGDYRYRVTQLGVTQGLEVMAELAKMLLPGMGGMASGGLGKILQADTGSQQFAMAATKLAQAIDSAKVQKVVKVLAKTTAVFGEGFGDAGAPLDIHLEDHFAGRYGELVGWMKFALEVNYGNFFEGLKNSGLLQPDTEDEQEQLPFPQG